MSDGEQNEDHDEDDAGINYQDVDDDDEDEEMEDDEDYDPMDDEAQYRYDESHATAEAYITRANKLRANAEKLRGLYKKGVTKNQRRQGTAEYKKKSACSKCGQLGHLAS